MIGSAGCYKSYTLHTTIEPSITTEFHTTEPMSELLRREIKINGTTFTYLEHTLSEIRKIGLERYTRNIVEGHTATSIHEPNTAHTITIHATKTIYSPTTVYTSMYSSPCPSKLAATRQTTSLNLALPATGAVVALLISSLIVVTIGWVWTCWSLQKKETKLQIIR